MVFISLGAGTGWMEHCEKDRRHILNCLKVFLTVWYQIYSPKLSGKKLSFTFPELQSKPGKGTTFIWVARNVKVFYCICLDGHSREYKAKGSSNTLLITTSPA